MLDPLTILPVVLAAFLGMVAAWYGLGVLVRSACDARARRSNVGRGRIMLTYDDGPGRTVTPKLLDLLREHETRATFFLIGRSAEQAPDLVKRLAAEGHTIGWQTQTHCNQWKVGLIRGLADVWKPRGVLASGGTRVTVFRPPYGKMTLGTVVAAQMRRLPILTWTHVSGDTHEVLPDPAATSSVTEAA